MGCRRFRSTEVAACREPAEGQHDDLVLAVALAAWMGEKCLPEGPVGLPQVLGG
jgi:hypothetical protein